MLERAFQILSKELNVRNYGIKYNTYQLKATLQFIFIVILLHLYLFINKIIIFTCITVTAIAMVINGHDDGKVIFFDTSFFLLPLISLSLLLLLPSPSL